jgi:hypothetical protein
MEEGNECWHFKTGGRQYPEDTLLVKLDYVPSRNGEDITVWAGKGTVVASSLSSMWSPKDTARHSTTHILLMSVCVSEVEVVRKSDSWSVMKGFRNRPCLEC